MVSFQITGETRLERIVDAVMTYAVAPLVAWAGVEQVIRWAGWVWRML